MQYNEVLNRLQNLIKYSPSQAELCQVTGVKQSTMSNRATRNSEFDNDEIVTLNKFYNVNLFTNTLQKNNFEFVSQNKDYTDLPVLGNVSASMGSGIAIYDETNTGTYAISNKLAKDINANLSQCDVIFAKGDSMEPTITGGDSLLVDKSKKEIYDGRIYCIRYDGEIYAKRLQKLPPKKIKVVSDNQAKYDSWYVDFSKDNDFDFEVIGEVLWWGRVAR